MQLRGTLSFLFLGIFLISSAQSVSHPCLMFSQKEVAKIKSAAGKYPLWDNSVREIRKQADNALASSVIVPVPKDGGGGYTHEKHKQNYSSMYAAGIAYQFTGEKRYAAYVISMLKEYAHLYPRLGLHPERKPGTAGKLFWQGLNDCVWLVYTSIAYDCVFTAASESERKLFEDSLFTPMANFLSVGSPQTFNRIHNHGTWAVAAVGMIGIALGKEEWVKQALLGLNKDGKGGFLKQIDELFSPDGYYAEGPYYQRYSLLPFVMFARTLNYNRKSDNIFGYRDKVLLKAIDVALQTSYNKAFFPINDALKEKTYITDELVIGVDIAFGFNPQRTDLLTIAREQNKVIPSGEGLEVAKAISEGKTQPYLFASMLLRDGADGKQGALAILRAGENNQSCLVFKATSHGLSHGHFDKLNFLFYDNGREIIQDYGSARFLNVETKQGGQYLPENDTYSKHTISHNTVVVDETSHYNGKLDISSKFAPSVLYASLNEKAFQIVMAEDTNAYPGVKLKRAMMMVNDSIFKSPVVFDLFVTKSANMHQYDLPFFYLGQITDIGFDKETALASKNVLGNKNGYQHLWVDAKGKANKEAGYLTWLNNNRFYTLTTTMKPEDEVFLVQTGATDPNFNLRRDPGIIIRKKGQEAVFLSVLEIHGVYDPIKEFTQGSESAIKNVALVAQTATEAVFKVALKQGKVYKVCLSLSNEPKQKHQVFADGVNYSWEGNYRIIK